jgi:hypothetical protein
MFVGKSVSTPLGSSLAFKNQIKAEVTDIEKHTSLFRYSNIYDLGQFHKTFSAIIYATIGVLP